MLRLKYINLSLALGVLLLTLTLVTGNPINLAKPRDEPSATKPHWIHGLPHLSALPGNSNQDKPRNEPPNTEPQRIHSPPPPGRTPPGFAPESIPGRYFAHPTKAAERRHPALEVGVDMLGHRPADVHIPEAVEGKRTPPSDLDSLGHVAFEGFHHDPLEDKDMTRFPPLHPLPSKTLTSEFPLLSAGGNVEPCRANPTKACFILGGEPITVGNWFISGPNPEPSPPSKPSSAGNSFPGGPNPNPGPPPPATVATAGNWFTGSPNPAIELVTAVKRIPLPDPLRPAKTLTGENPLLSAAADVHPCSSDPSQACFILNGQPVTVGNWIPAGAAAQPLPSKTASVTQPSPLPSAVIYPVPCSAAPDMACIFVAGQPVTVGTWEPTGASTQSPVSATTSQIAVEEPHRKHHSHPHPHPPPSFTIVTIPGKSASEIGTITVITDGKGPETGSFTINAGTVTLTATAEPPMPTNTQLHVHATELSPPKEKKRDVHAANEIAARTHKVKTTHHAKHCHTTINVARPHDFDIPPTKTIWTWTTFTYLTVDCGGCTLVTKDAYKPTPPSKFTAMITTSGSTISTGYTCKQTYSLAA